MDTDMNMIWIWMCLRECAEAQKVEVLNGSLSRAAVPHHQSSINLDCCLGQPSGDSRTTTKTRML